ncbi:hypothetical protein EDD86DRAFT_202102 [Gorgonomyces haynaldii]|nr:hypothetical protein EDD86DRAFT_202102 [Gorgonomyces haynaldii]
MSSPGRLAFEERIQLSNWFFIKKKVPKARIQFYKSAEWIVLGGERWSEQESELWSSSLIKSRLQSHQIMTISDKMYELIGKPSDQMMAKHGFSLEFCAQFSDGFPKNWEQLVHAVINAQEPKRATAIETSLSEVSVIEIDPLTPKRSLDQDLQDKSSQNSVVHVLENDQERKGSQHFDRNHRMTATERQTRGVGVQTTISRHHAQNQTILPVLHTQDLTQAGVQISATQEIQVDNQIPQRAVVNVATETNRDAVSKSVQTETTAEQTAVNSHKMIPKTVQKTMESQTDYSFAPGVKVGMLIRQEPLPASIELWTSEDERSPKLGPKRGEIYVTSSTEKPERVLVPNSMETTVQSQEFESPTRESMDILDISFESPKRYSVDIVDPIPIAADLPKRHSASSVEPIAVVSPKKDNVESVEPMIDTPKKTIIHAAETQNNEAVDLVDPILGDTPKRPSVAQDRAAEDTPKRRYATKTIQETPLKRSLKKKRPLESATPIRSSNKKVKQEPILLDTPKQKSVSRNDTKHASPIVKTMSPAVKSPRSSAVKRVRSPAKTPLKSMLFPALQASITEMYRKTPRSKSVEPEKPSVRFPEKRRSSLPFEHDSAFLRESLEMTKEPTVKREKAREHKDTSKDVVYVSDDDITAQKNETITISSDEEDAKQSQSPSQMTVTRSGRRLKTPREWWKSSLH